MFNNPLSALPYVKAGRLRALAVTSLKRAAAAPEVPTMVESGYPGFEAGTWYAFLAPAGLPRDLQARLASDIITVAQMDDVRARFAALAIESMGSTPEQLAAVMQSDLDKWARVIRAANIKAD